MCARCAHSPYLRNNWTDRTEIWCMARGPPAMRLIQDGECPRARKTVHTFEHLFALARLSPKRLLVFVFSVSSYQNFVIKLNANFAPQTLGTVNPFHFEAVFFFLLTDSLGSSFLFAFNKHLRATL